MTTSERSFGTSESVPFQNSTRGEIIGSLLDVDRFYRLGLRLSDCWNPSLRRRCGQSALDFAGFLDGAIARGTQRHKLLGFDVEALAFRRVEERLAHDPVDGLRAE